ncbi:class I SAM-dependent methyltransferase [Candidatus Woesearchaeota archaeon]|nr:class I SAM-dependent methyltransferase [Candidatus Woesearchaeota archaeon]
MIAREEIIRRYIKDANVLDIGCVSNKIWTGGELGQLHKFLLRYAKTVTGIDYHKEGIKILKKKGYNVFHGNAEDIDLKKEFDVVVAGELLEHLENPGRFLKNMRKHMKINARLILTTPNAFSIRNILRQLLFGRVPTNKEHTHWHNLATLKQLIERNGLKLERSYYLYDHPHTTKGMMERLLCIRKQFRPQILVVCSK